MENKTVINIELVIEYIEQHLDGRLDLDTIALESHYSKYHLHRMFTSTTGMTIHDYVQRRQLTEAAKLLVFSQKSILEIALMCGYESQQSFSSAFKSMYKLTPAEYRNHQEFYPLQLRFTLCRDTTAKKFTRDDICPASQSDIPAWMELMRLVIDGYPVMNEEEYLKEITRCIREKRGLVLKQKKTLIGAMAYSIGPCSIEFLGIHPQYRNQGIQKLFLDTLLNELLPGQEITMTTFREGDKADTGYRSLLKQLGFAERELLFEFGYPTQRFVFSPALQTEHSKGENQ